MTNSVSYHNKSSNTLATWHALQKLWIRKPVPWFQQKVLGLLNEL